MPTKKFKDFCPGSFLEGRTETLKILVGILGETMTSQIHSELNCTLVSVLLRQSVTKEINEVIYLFPLF